MVEGHATRPWRESYFNWSKGGAKSTVKTANFTQVYLKTCLSHEILYTYTSPHSKFPMRTFKRHTLHFQQITLGKSQMLTKHCVVLVPSSSKIKDLFLRSFIVTHSCCNHTQTYVAKFQTMLQTVPLF